jgi:aspartate kinase
LRLNVLTNFSQNASLSYRFIERYAKREAKSRVSVFLPPDNHMATLIMKFGGTSVGMTTGLTQVLSIVLYEVERWDRLLLVVSALEGVTDALIEAAHLAQLANRRGYRRIVATLRTRHLALIEHLPLGTVERSALQADIDRLLFDMLDICQNLADRAEEKAKPEAIDAIIGVGERLSARIVAALLRQNNLRGVAIDATDLIITDNVYGNAMPNIELSRERITRLLAPMLDRKIIPVITGFIGSTIEGKPTTLGRGGSDYTASVLGVCTDAEAVWIWTDVDGMMTADPREVNTAQVIPALSYDEVAELAYFGARILHARMIGPLRERHIPLRIRNVFKPQGEGTLVKEQPSAAAPALKAVTSIQGLGLTAPHGGPLYRLAALVDEALFSVSGTHTEVMIASQSSSHSFVCFVISTSAGPDALHNLQIALEQRSNVWVSNGIWTMFPVSVITLIGTRFDELHSLTARILTTLEGIRILVWSQSRSSLSLVVEPHISERAIHQIHTLVINSG